MTAYTADALADTPVAPLLSPQELSPSLLGESPLWHPVERCLYWVDIAGQALQRFDPESGVHRRWELPAEPGCCAALLDRRGGGLLLAMRDGLWRFDGEAQAGAGGRTLIAPPPYDPQSQRWNDGKVDAQGRFWVGTLDDARQPQAALYCYQREGAALREQRVFDGFVNSNGLAFAEDGRTLYWADTRNHQVLAFRVDTHDGSLSGRRELARFSPRAEGQPLSDYGGRPDGAAVDSEGAYWVAMYEGQRLLRLAADGRCLQTVALPVRCATMCTFGGDDLRTLYITTARHGRPADELAQQPWAGCVLQLRVTVAGLPTHLAQL